MRVWDWYVTSTTDSHCSLCDSPFRAFSENLSVQSTRWLQGIVSAQTTLSEVSSFLEIHRAETPQVAPLSEAPLGPGSASRSHPDQGLPVD